MDISDLILSIYDAAIEPTLWPEVLLRVSHFVGARGATVFELEEIGELDNLKMSMCSENYSPDRNSYYLKYYWQDELKDQEIFAYHSKRTDQIELIPDSVLSSSREALLAKEHVQVLRKFEVGYRAAALLNKDLPSKDRFAFQFSEAHGPMDKAVAQKSNLILPHLAKALNVSRPIRELAAQNKAISAGLNLLMIGVCIVDQERRILVTNTEFERQLDCYDAFTRSRNGRLIFDDGLAPNLSAQLSSSFQFHGLSGARPRKEAVIFASKSKEQHLCIDIVPLENASELDLRSSHSSLIFSLDTSAHFGFDANKIGQIYDLTTTELEVLELVSEGYTNQQISDCLEKSIHTVDSQLKSVLSKAMAANRTQLIRITSQTRSFLANP